ncbi:hypothetical protein K1Y77_17295 (plasmid) [Halomonas qaidamensis]|uniref:Uncharacterized protein n=1 Tax=Halomonas qaidamensis TaxID=2866211 RepID=A0ABY6JWR6_9GAMM|nr:hypothetical protein [Halomonas qaidamensis]UYV20917.1 hypothetical protein K1Y77_17295 [Halomonas qaidamensis]
MQDYDITNALKARVASECPGFAVVDEAWFSEPIDDYNDKTPAAYVYLAEDSAEAANELSRRQATAQVYGVFIICETGDTFRAQRHQVREALFGWQPPGSSGVMAFHSGQMQEIRGRYVWWREYWTLETPNALTASRTVTI